MQTDTGFTSSLLVKPPVIGIWLALCVVAVLFDKTPIAVFLGFIFVLTLSSYLWARSALGGVECELHRDRSYLYPGQTFIVRRTVRNRKAMPLIWSEIRERCERDDPASPDERIIVFREIPASEEDSEPVKIYERLYRMSLVNPYRSVSFNDKWEAKHRGIMELGASVVRSGDGFGLCTVDKVFERHGEGRIVVLPAPASVSVSDILNEMWDTKSEKDGYLKDRTIIKSVRNYTPGDSAKDINMRMLARGQGMQVNVFETVTPDTILFIFDSKSFRGKPADLLEHSLSVTAALIDGLTKRGVRVSLMTPKSKWFPETCTTPSCGEKEGLAMLELLAAVSADDEPPARELPEFVYEAGRIYCVCADTESAYSAAALDKLLHEKTFLLTARGGGADIDSSRIRSRSLFDFERAG